jgi:hypothetical protein
VPALIHGTHLIGWADLRSLYRMPLCDADFG